MGYQGQGYQASDQAHRGDHQYSAIAATGGQSWREESSQHSDELPHTGDQTDIGGRQIQNRVHIGTQEGPRGGPSAMAKAHIRDHQRHRQQCEGSAGFRPVRSSDWLDLPDEAQWNESP
jgi:hypothetical protein